jgi:hypothetical protein
MFMFPENLDNEGKEKNKNAHDGWYKKPSLAMETDVQPSAPEHTYEKDNPRSCSVNLLGFQ